MSFDLAGLRPVNFLLVHHDWIEFVVSLCKNEKDFFERTHWFNKYSDEFENFKEAALFLELDSVKLYDLQSLTSLNWKDAD